MSTFDTMCEWREGQVSDLGAMICCLDHLKIAVPGVQYHESFIALYKIVESALEPETKRENVEAYFAWCRHSEAWRGHD